MNKLRYINVKKPLAPQIKAASADTLISQFEQKKKADTTIKKVDKDYLEEATSFETMK
jgi:hypothetical protein